ncbi:outer membrane assembly protein AsmA [Candidatus Hamiltonella defensa]|uniref:Outer membrane assembly protein AsmA n=1 Tax=Candidatus Williamhamiltonella defendens TaxID=138072 RepID=A0AAC9YFZ2_9ENTR|nr:outer membrane assembly protein AsmA [Candidatus Hamiltonella defensa]ASV32818.1 outer membrane assembly protein AsmA [Candidatus Hamiltonella defensa]AWK15771.1 outer membrane assembly protein AsmA [Candidatus Hamiltonella defensa]MBK4361292.1 outer membrane assembly protein AsmA [Candidatus Hamiltonella defensa]
MKKLMTVFIIVLVLLAGGMTALVVLLNPNDFRGYLAQQIEKRSGYQLALEGDLRWHVWPQLSVIAGQMSLTAPGAKKSIISAQNMRLDVELWPLLSHQLKVKQVSLKGARINLIPESQPKTPKNLPTVSKEEVDPDHASTSNWKLGIDKVQLMDSLLIWQKEDEAQINVRNVNLDLVQNENKQVKISLLSQINRDQRDLTVSLKAAVDLHQYPQKWDADIQQLSYQLQGADLPVNGIKGTMTLQAQYDKPSEKLTFNQLNFSANNNHFIGNAEAILSSIPTYLIRLRAQNINLDEILGWTPLKKDNTKNQSTTAVTVPTPVIATTTDNNEDSSQNLQVLRDFNTDFLLNIDQISYQGIKVKNIKLALKNHQGRLSLNPLSGELFEGNFLLNATADLTKKKMQMTLNPTLKNIDLKSLLQGLSLSPLISGKASLKGIFSGHGLNLQAFMTQWKGDAKIVMQPVQFNGVNIQQLIEQTVAKNMHVANVEKIYKPYTDIQKLESDLKLNAGKLEINHLKADSHFVSIKGKGIFNLPEQQSNMNLNVRLLQDFKGQADWIKTLQDIDVPLHIYGPWAHLQYRIDVQSLLNKNLKGQFQKKLNHWFKERLNESR